jgi:hypothetical protein
VRIAVAAFALLGTWPAAGCHPDACVWSVARVGDEATATLERDDTALAATEVTAGGNSTRDQRTGANATYVSVRLTVENDPIVGTAVLTINLAEPAPGPMTLSLGATTSVLRLVQGSVIVGEGAPSGTITFTRFDAPCEFSDTYIDSSSGWDCATNLDASIDAQLATGGETYRLAAVLSQRETLTETCHSCSGIEGCDY